MNKKVTEWPLLLAQIVVTIWRLLCSTLDELQLKYKSQFGSTQAVASLIVAISSLS